MSTTPQMPADCSTAFGLGIRDGETLAYGYNFDWQSRGVFCSPRERRR